MGWAIDAKLTDNSNRGDYSTTGGQNVASVGPKFDLGGISSGFSMKNSDPTEILGMMNSPFFTQPTQGASRIGAAFSSLAPAGGLVAWLPAIGLSVAAGLIVWYITRRH